MFTNYLPASAPIRINTVSAQRSVLFTSDELQSVDKLVGQRLSKCGDSWRRCGCYFFSDRRSISRCSCVIKTAALQLHLPNETDRNVEQSLRNCNRLPSNSMTAFIRTEHSQFYLAISSLANYTNYLTRFACGLLCSVSETLHY